MFACNVYDLNDDFERNIIAETTDIVRRIRHHACLGLWCGNNEMEWGWRDWARLEGHDPKYKADYTKIFEFILPRLVQKLDDTTSYWLSSPSSGGSFDDPNDFNRGDNHYWEVWHSNKPFTEYRDFHFRFCSEFGFQSFPSIRTIREFCPSEEEDIFSETMESHQKNGQANGKIFSYVSQYFRYPKDMENIAYISQILQLKAIQYGVEHWRRNRGRCMGSLYWQFNDCWPVASWASVDYYGRWKALHYGAKRFYSLFMASACEKEELSPQIQYFVHNDTTEVKKARLRVYLSDMNFNKLCDQTIDVTVSPLTAQSVYETDFTEYVNSSEKELFAAYELIENKVIVSRGITLFSKPKHISMPKPKYKVKVEETGDKFMIELSASCFAHFVEISFKNIDAVLSDNYFDITENEMVRVEVLKADISAEGYTAQMLEDEIQLKSVVDSY
ncbi:MAG: glycoside hydrolase family 2 sugar binding protein, partial [Clostridia bacterium]|nr:glycoside hydrolase family 2 sugar binding protein [Clostridia bacterium]